MSKVHLSRLIAPAFHPLHSKMRDGSITELWLKGGRGSAKSSFASLQIPLMLLEDREASAIVYRRVGQTIKDSVFAQMIWALEQLGLTPWFQVRVSPFEMALKATGQKILFRGSDDPDKSKSLKLARGYFKVLWFEELPEFSGIDELRTIKASVFRGGSEPGITIASYNPPKSANNWVNAEAMAPHPGRLVHHSCYTDVDPAWLGPTFLAEAEALRLTNERAYRHMYLGEVTGTGGAVFDNVQLREITQDERKRFDRFLNGGDFGFASDPDVVLRCHLDKRARTLYLLDEVYGAQMNIDTLAERALDLVGHEYVTYDSADPRMINELNRRGVRALPAKKGPGSVEHGMRWLQDLAAIVIDPKRCPNAAREFTAYEYPMDRYGNFLSTYQDRDNHTIDAARYACESEMQGRLGFAQTAGPGGRTDRIYVR